MGIKATEAMPMQYALPLGPEFTLFNEDGSINQEILKNLRRKVLRMTREEFAESMGVPLSTYKSWESKKQARKPSAASKSLLRIAVARPDVIREVFGVKPESADVEAEGTEEMTTQ